MEDVCVLQINDTREYVAIPFRPSLSTKVEHGGSGNSRKTRTSLLRLDDFNRSIAFMPDTFQFLHVPLG